MQAWANAVQWTSFIPLEEDLIMAPNPLFYQLLVVALVLICLLIHIGLPDKPLSLPQPPLASTTRRRTRSTAPKPFPGLLRKPLCEACAQEAEARPTASGSPPPFIRFARGRRRTVAYLGATDNISRPLPSRLSDVNQPITCSRRTLVRPHPTRLACLCAHLSRATPRLSTGTGA